MASGRLKIVVSTVRFCPSPPSLTHSVCCTSHLPLRRFATPRNCNLAQSWRNLGALGSLAPFPGQRFFHVSAAERLGGEVEIPLRHLKIGVPQPARDFQQIDLLFPPPRRTLAPQVVKV